MEGDFEEFDFDIEEEEQEENPFWSWSKKAIAIFVVLGILYVYGLSQYFFFQRTPQSRTEERVEKKVDAEMLTIPLDVYLVRGEEFYGSSRSEEDVRTLVENAGRIWNQAGISFEINKIRTVFRTTEEIRSLYGDPYGFTLSIPGFDQSSISVILVGNLGGINGVAFGGVNAVAVADFTTVLDFRALAHEIGHILRLSHVSDRTGRLMYQGANGTDLSIEEIERARSRAGVFLE